MSDLCPKRAGAQHDWFRLGKNDAGRWVWRCNQCFGQAQCEVETARPTGIGDSP